MAAERVTEKRCVKGRQGKGVGEEGRRWRKRRRMVKMREKRGRRRKGRVKMSELNDVAGGGGLQAAAEATPQVLRRSVSPQTKQDARRRCRETVPGWWG
jgi:hypothetical protein